MIIVDGTIDKEQLKSIAQYCFGDMIKAVVDIKRQLLAIDAELHADLETLLLEDGSEQENLWGINLYPDLEPEDFIEFDSLINIRPRQNNKTRDVEDKVIREKIEETIERWIK